jgi:hypothetical protein
MNSSQVGNIQSNKVEETKEEEASTNVTEGSLVDPTPQTKSEAPIYSYLSCPEASQQEGGEISWFDPVC